MNEAEIQRIVVRMVGDSSSLKKSLAKAVVDVDRFASMVQRKINSISTKKLTKQLNAVARRTLLEKRIERTGEFVQKRSADVGRAISGSLRGFGDSIYSVGSRVGNSLVSTARNLHTLGNRVGGRIASVGATIGRNLTSLGLNTNRGIRGFANWIGRSQYAIGRQLGGRSGGWISRQARAGNLGGRFLFNLGNPVGGFIGRTGASIRRGFATAGSVASRAVSFAAHPNVGDRLRGLGGGIHRRATGAGLAVSGGLRRLANWVGPAQYRLGGRLGGTLGAWISQQARRGNLGSRFLWNAGNPLGSLVARSGRAAARGLSTLGSFADRFPSPARLVGILGQSVRNVSQGIGSRVFNAGNAVGGFIGRAGRWAGQGIARTAPSLARGLVGVGSAIGPISTVLGGALSVTQKFGSTLLRIPSAMGSVVGSISSGFQRISGSIHNSLTELQNFGLKLRTAGIYATAVVTAPVVGAVTAAAGEYRSVDKAIAEAGARVGGISKADKQEMIQTALDFSMSGKTAFSPTELTKTYQELGAAGLQSPMAMQMAMPFVAQFAQAGEFDTQKATIRLMETMGARGLYLRRNAGFMETQAYIEQMQRHGDAMVAMANLFTGDVDEASRAMSRSTLQVAKQYGIEIEETAAILGVYAQAGYKAEPAGTLFSQGIRLLTRSYLGKSDVWKKEGLDMVDPNTGGYLKLTDFIEKLEKKTAGMTGPQRQAFLMKLGMRDVRQQKAVDLLVGNSKVIRQTEAEIKKGGQTALMASQQMEALDNQIKAMWNSWKVLAYEIGGMFRPVMDGAIEAMKQAAQFVRGLDGPTKELIVTLALAAAAIGPLLIGIGTIAALVVAFGSAIAFLITPFTLLFAPGGILAGALILLAAMRLSLVNFDFRGVWDRAKQGLTGFYTHFANFLRNFRENMGILMDWLFLRWEGFRAWSAGVWEFFTKTTLAALNAVFPSLEQFWAKLDAQGIDGLTTLIGQMFLSIGGFVANLPQNLQTIFTWMQQNWKASWDFALEYGALAIEHLGQGLIRIFNVIGNALLSAAIPAFYTLLEIFKVGFGDMLRDIIATGVGMIKSVVNSIPQPLLTMMPMLSTLKTGVLGMTGVLDKKTLDYLDSRSIQEQLRVRAKYQDLADAEGDPARKHAILMEGRQKEAEVAARFANERRTYLAGGGTNLSLGALDATLRDVQNNNPLNAIAGIMLDTHRRFGQAAAGLDTTRFSDFPGLNLGLPNAQLPLFNIGGPKMGQGALAPAEVAAEGNVTLEGILGAVKELIDVTKTASGKPPVLFKAGLN